MKNEERDINNIFGTILFVILFSSFAFIFDCKSNNSPSESANYSLQPESAPGYYSGHLDNILFDTPHLPVVVKDSGYSLYGSNLSSFNINFKILNYNRKIVQHIILVEKTSLSIVPPSVWKYSFHLASRDKEDLPFLS